MLSDFIRDDLMQTPKIFESGSSGKRDESTKTSNKPSGSMLRMMDPSFVLAAVGTVVFYGIVLQPSMHGSVLHRYTTEHVVEYAIVALFIWGMIDICFKCARFPREFRALRAEWLPPCRSREPITVVESLLQRLRSLPKWQQESRLGLCLIEMLDIIAEKGSIKDCRDDHNRLMEREDDRLHNDYILLRFVVGVTPILGFLGTVVHFGTALSGMSFDEMTEKLPVVVAEMGMAFNTTTVALAVAMSTMFLMFLCERIERGLMGSVDRFVTREVINRFEVAEQNQQLFDPFLETLRSAHETALRSVATSLERQFNTWGTHLEGLLQRFDAHQESASQAWQNALTVLQERQETYAAASDERLQNTLNLIDSAESRHLMAIKTIIDEAASFREDVVGFSNALESVAREEGQLAEVQNSLASNLRVLQQSGQIDEALHGLTAAIHLMTVRHSPLDRAA
jgi:hypothetical protein